MKKIFIVLLFINLSVFSQTEKDSLSTNDSIKKWSVLGKIDFLFNQTSFSNWKSGGDNTIAGKIALNYDLNYKKGKWNWDNKIISLFGLSHIDGKGYRKTDDQLELNSILGNKIGGNWFLSFFTNFKTQYVKGFKYAKDGSKIQVSDFLSPGYLSFAPGILWKKSDNFRINITPATARFIFVSEQFSGSFGVKKGKTTNFGIGFNLSTFYKFNIMKNVTMENNLVLYSDYLDNPEDVDVNYQITFLAKANKYLTMSLGLHTIIDNNTSKEIQFKEGLGFGINYLFHKI